jgi:transcriptional regulator with XRE-family HTH domain
VAVAERAVRHVRKFLGQRLRALRKQRGLSQERLGERSQLSGKFIGEVERGEKSISIDSLYRVSVALEVPLRDLTDVRADKIGAVPGERPRRSSLSSPAGAGRRTSARRTRSCGRCSEGRRPGLIPSRRLPEHAR